MSEDTRNTKKSKRRRNKGFPYRESSGKDKRVEKEEILTDNWDWLD